MRGPADPSRPGIVPIVVAALAAASVAAPLGAQEPAPAEPGTARPAAPSPEAPELAADDSASPDPVWLRLAGGATALAALVSFDPSVRRGGGAATATGAPGALPAGGGVPGALARVGNTLGDWQTTLPWVAGLSLAVGGATEGWDGVGRATALLAGVAAGSFGNEAINQAVGRARPSWEDDALAFDAFSGHTSFPSGHAAFAFSIAGGVDAVTEGWLPAAAAYAAASTSAFARLHTRKHWLSDVIVGSAVGALASRTAARRVLRALGVEDAAEDPPDGRRGARPGEPGAELIASPGFLGVRVRF